MEKRDFVTDKPSRPKTRHHALSETVGINQMPQEKNNTHLPSKNMNLDTDILMLLIEQS